MGVSGRVWGHSGSRCGRWQPLDEHVRQVAELARRFADVFGGGDVAWWLGLLHDVGKCGCDWQARLAEVADSGRPVGCDHKLLGVQMAEERGFGWFALAIDGHHGGLASPAAVRNRLADPKTCPPERMASARSAAEQLLPEVVNSGPAELPASWQNNPLVAEMALRLVFSALCDADHLDTAAHFADEPHRVLPSADFAALRERFEGRRADLLTERGTRGPIDGIRETVYQSCVRAAAEPPGFFRLAAPTGVGKTISAGGFAVHHAARHGLRRVVVAVPFLTITEQNADVYRSLLDADGDAVVLEHHSGVDFDAAGERARLAAENWDAPFVITTTVRLFHSLFDRRPSAMRRLHRLAGSVIVLDEVQALPHDVLIPVLDALRTLVEYFGVTVLLASATQPDFWRLSPFDDLKAVDIVAAPQKLVSRLRRVSFDWRTAADVTLADVAEEAADAEQALVVVNTTADAKTVYERWRAQADEGIAWHLSTRMCGAHRRRVLAEVRERLRAGRPVLLVSTQLIEAGVDVDFPLGFRVLAPADSLLQAAGRVNREGSLDGLGRLVIVDPLDAGRPPSYRRLTDATRVHFGPGKADPDDLVALRAYYRAVYSGMNLEHPASVGQRIQQARRHFDFVTVTQGPEIDAATRARDSRYAFRMIREEGVTLVTAEGAATKGESCAVEQLVNEIRTVPRPDRRSFRRLQPYVTTVHRSALRDPAIRAQIRPIIGDPDAPGALAEWIGGYDDQTGIDFDPAAESFVV